MLRDTALVNSIGPALTADRVRVGGSALLDRGFLAQGERPDGVVRLARAEIGGDLLMTGARLASGTGPALVADGLTVHGDLMLAAAAAAAAAAPGRPFTAAGRARPGRSARRVQRGRHPVAGRGGGRALRPGWPRGPDWPGCLR